MTELKKLTFIQGGNSGSFFWDVVYKIEDTFGIDLPSPDDYE